MTTEGWRVVGRGSNRPSPARRSALGKTNAHTVFGAALLVLSGAAALAHETLWTRRLVDVLGATGEASARVLGCFFLGLALGAAIGGGIARRTRRPWAIAAIAEAAVALLSLPVLLLPYWTDWLWPVLGPDRLAGWHGVLAKLLVSTLAVIPPAVAMGTVLPLAVTALLQGTEELTGRGVRLYALNTLGGAMGLVLVAGVVLQLLGSFGAMVLVATVNLVVAAGFMALNFVIPRVDASPSMPIDTGNRSQQWFSPLLVAAASGFAVLAFEVLALRAVMLVAPLSFHAPAVVLASVILCLAIAAFLAPRLVGEQPQDLTWLLVTAGLVLAVTPLLFMALARQMDLGPSPTFPVFLAKLACFAGLALGPGLIAAGLVFPAAASALRAAGVVRPGAWGLLLAVNGIAGWLGAEWAYSVLLPTVGIYAGIEYAGLVLPVVALVLGLRRPEAARTGSLAVAGGGVLAVLALTTGILPKLPLVNPELKLHVVDQRSDREGTVAVVEHPSLGRAILLSNQYLLGSSNAAGEQRRQAHLPLLLHSDPRQVAFIGVATGITPGAALNHECVEHVTAIELSRAVVDVADIYFADQNGGLIGDRRVDVVIEDGRTLLAASPGRYDVVVGDLILPWLPGEGRLYSAEHFRAAKASLRPGGLYCQWLPMYQLTEAQFDSVLATFRSVFPKAELFRREFGAGTPALALVGYRDGMSTDWTVVGRRCMEARRRDGIADAPAPAEIAASALSVPNAEPAPLNTLDRPCIELDAAVQRVTGSPGRKYLAGRRWESFLKRQFSAGLDRTFSRSQ